MDRFLSKFMKKTKISMNKTNKKYNFYLINVIKRLKKYKIKLISIGKKQL